MIGTSTEGFYPVQENVTYMYNSLFPYPSTEYISKCRQIRNIFHKDFPIGPAVEVR